MLDKKKEVASRVRGAAQDREDNRVRNWLQQLI
jgi:hypothetical protein